MEGARSSRPVPNPALCAHTRLRSLVPAGAYMCIHALHRLERGSSASSSAEVAALDAVAAREWEHPDAAGASLDGVQRQLEAERQAQARRQQLQQEGQPEAERPGGAAGVDRNGSSDSGGRAGEGASSSGVRSNVVKVIGLYPFLQGADWEALPAAWAAPAGLQRAAAHASKRLCPAAHLEAPFP